VIDRQVLPEYGEKCFMEWVVDEVFEGTIDLIGAALPAGCRLGGFFCTWLRTGPD